MEKLPMSARTVVVTGAFGNLGGVVAALSAPSA
jgi:hypothetical protein